MARIDDGFSTTLEFADFPTVAFYEKTVTPPGMSGGGANDTTTMHNTTWRTMAPKQLKTMSEGSAKVSYDPVVYQDVVSMINVNQLITVNFPDGSSLDFWGWLDEFTPDEVSEGAQPTATIKIIPSNQNDSLVETAPVYNAP
jgi:hypothetical protein